MEQMSTPLGSVQNRTETEKLNQTNHSLSLIRTYCVLAYPSMSYLI